MRSRSESHCTQRLFQAGVLSVPPRLGQVAQDCDVRVAAWSLHEKGPGLAHHLAFRPVRGAVTSPSQWACSIPSAESPKVEPGSEAKDILESETQEFLPLITEQG
jgi:hypothetical protein